MKEQELKNQETRLAYKLGDKLKKALGLDDRFELKINQDQTSEEKADKDKD